MPFTVITLKKVPSSLRGDLTKWMQEIATGVYIGNFNSRVREELWKRVLENVSEGEATISFTSRNELGYEFKTVNSNRLSVDLEGLPLVLTLLEDENIRSNDDLKRGFSNALRFHKARKGAGLSRKKEDIYCFIDVETTGLDPQNDKLIEIGAIKVQGDQLKEFSELIHIEENLPKEIINLTGIQDEELKVKGKSAKVVLEKFLDFIEGTILVGYNVIFDVNMINGDLTRENMYKMPNQYIDLKKYVKQEKVLLQNYKLVTVLEEYGISNQVPHRALEDARLIYSLSKKVNKFQEAICKK